jgi:biopolymer transport protein ExbB/TolQ
MTAIGELIGKGGPVMYAIIALSAVLYSRCFLLVLSLRQSRRALRQEPPAGPAQFERLHRLRDGIAESFRQQRIALGAMIAAAPLLGLLGTVSGLVKTFDSMSTRAGQRSMEELAGGISQVLVATESGLMVAIPALLLVYFAHREVRKQLEQLSQLEEPPRGAVTP